MYKILISENETEIISAKNCKIDFIMIDLEINKKLERQKNTNFNINYHNLTSISKAREYLGKKSKTKLLVRCNPYSLESEKEINSIINLGADRIMIPMFRTAKEIELFKKIGTVLKINLYGIDFIIPNIYKSYKIQICGVNEVNSAPNFIPHYYMDNNYENYSKCNVIEKFIKLYFNS